MFLHPSLTYRARRTPRALLLAFILALLLGPALAFASSPEPPTCLGRTVPEWQALGYQIRLGTAGNDVLNAPWQKTVLFGLEGDDVLNDGGNDGILCGGPGNDTLNGYGGLNTLVGGDGDDLLNGGPKRDHLIGGEVVVVGQGAPPFPPEYQRPPGWYAGIAAHLDDPWGDLIYAHGLILECAPPPDGATDDDVLLEFAGGAGEERNVPTRLWGCAGNDRLEEHDGDGYMHGGEGDDILIGGPGNDWLSGGPGLDECDGGLHQGNTNGVWAAIDSAYDGTCETVLNVP